MNNNYINTIIDTWDDFNKNKYEILLYSINDLIINMNNNIDDINDNDDDDDIDAKNQLLKNIEYCNTINDNYHIVIDTPCDDDMLAIIQFDENYNIIGFDSFQTIFDSIYCNPTENIYILNDCFQFFRKIDTTGLLQHIDNKWNYENRENDIFQIPCNILTKILKMWVNEYNK